MAYPPPQPAAPAVRLELRHGGARPIEYDVPGDEFVIGAVPGCDLRLSGTNLPPVVAVITRQPDGARIRKLAPTLPLLLNGRPVQSAALHAGDALTLGGLTITVHIDGPVAAAPAVSFLPVEPLPDQTVWPRTAERRPEIDARAVELAEQQREVEGLRDDLTAMRRDLYQRYQERRDRVAGLQQSVQNAARKLQERKRQFEEDVKRTGPILKEIETARADIDRRERELVTARLAAEEEQRRRDEEQQATARQLADRDAECSRRERAVTALEARYQSDLARLDRLQGTLEQRERQVDARLTEADTKYDDLRRDTLELEEQARQLDVAMGRQRDEDERLKRDRAEVDAAAAKLKERVALVEGQQAMLAALRTRLERMRDEVRQESQQLTEQRARQESVERELQSRLRAAEELRANIDAEGQSTTQARQHFEARSAELQTAVARLREMQDRLAGDQAAVEARAEQLDAQAAEQSAQTAILTERAGQLLELQHKLDADRTAIKEREAALAQAEEARKALQEQLRRRSEELGAKQKQLDDLTRRYDETAGRLGEQEQSVTQLRQQAEAAVATARQELEARATEVERAAAALAEREEAVHRQTERLKDAGLTLAAERKAHFESKAQWEADRKATAADTAKARADLAEYRKQIAEEAAHLQTQLPEMELRGAVVLERLGQAREQLRGHLAELHAYARQSQEDLEALRTQVQAEAERLRQQERAVQKSRAEHRLAVAGFRQQLIEWQGRVAEMRQVLTHDGTRLERQQAAVAAAAQQVDETNGQLARQAAELHAQEKQVAERRGEMERHLGDLREWYRGKLRELAESRAGARPDADPTIVPLPAPAADATTTPPDQPTASAPDILSLTEDLDPGDRQLGDLLRTLDLVDATTLTALLLEARRQRRSLRQVLLSGRAGGPPILTLYQLALIESGHLDGLMLGPLRVIDRLQATPHEVVYRVFDPRRAGDGGGTVLLRHLAEAEMHDAVRPDEFRQRFAALAAVDHPHLAATLEVLEVNGRPAALQEWLTGLPSFEWPATAAAPGVWYRLVGQAALGLNAAHQAGLVHGRLSARSIILTPAGVVKLTGCGEPPWLTGAAADATPADDLAALGELAAAWATITPRRKGAKPPRPLPESLQRVLARLRPDAADRYPTAAALLEDLERAGLDISDGPEAWDKLLHYAGENGTDGVAWRKSA